LTPRPRDSVLDARLCASLRRSLCRPGRLGRAYEAALGSRLGRNRPHFGRGGGTLGTYWLGLGLRRLGEAIWA